MIIDDGMDAIKDLSDELSDSSNAFDGVGQAAGMAATQIDNFKGDSALAKAALHDFAITMGDMLIPAFRKGMQAVTAVTEKVTTFIVENKEVVAIIGKVAAGLAAAKIAYLAIKLAILQVQGVYKTIKVVKAAYVLLQQKDIMDKKISIGLLIKEEAVTKANVGALVMAKTALIAKTAALKVAKLAQGAFNAVMAACPIYLVIMAVAALVTGIIALISWMGKNKKAQEEANKAASEFREETNNITNDMRDNVAQMEKSGEGNSKLAQVYRDGADAIEKQGYAIANAISQHRLNEEAIENLRDKQNAYIASVQKRIDLTKELEGIERGHADTQLALMDAEDRREEKAQALAKAIEEYGENSREAQRAALELESANNRLEDAQSKARSETELLANATELLSAAEREEVAAQRMLQVELANSTRDYADVNEAIRKLMEEGSENSIALRNQIIADAEANGAKWNEQLGVMEYDNRSAWKKMCDSVGAAFSKITGIFVVLAGWFNDNVIQPLINIFRPIVSKIGEIFAKLWEIITVLFGVLAAWFHNKVIAPVIEFFKGLFQTIKDIFSPIGEWFSSKFTESYEGITRVFSKVGKFFKGIWSYIVSIFTTIGTVIGNAIGDAFKFVVNSVIGFAEGLINKFIGGINKAINLINKIPGVNIELLTLLDVPRLEKGSSSTPDTFIAGDVGGKGGELVTNARGRKVFTAAHTDALIKSNLKHKRVYIFPAGIILTIPVITVKPPSTLPPWKRRAAP